MHKIRILAVIMFGFFSCTKEIGKAKKGELLFGHWFHYSSDSSFTNLNIFSNEQGSMLRFTPSETPLPIIKGTWYKRGKKLCFQASGGDKETFIIDSLPRAATTNFTVQNNSIYSGRRYLYLNGEIYTE